MKKLPPRAENLRRALAQEAARIMAEHGIRDYLTAKRKAAERFGVTDGNVLPRNTEIEDALAEYQRLFGGSRHDETLAAQRNAALSAMQLLSEFEPRLVGSVLSGTATEHNDIQLHLFAERAESITFRLMGLGIDHEVVERRMRYGTDRVVAYPGVHFELFRVDAAHRLAVHRTDRRLANAVDGKHRGVDHVVVEFEMHARIGDHAIGAVTHPAFHDFMIYAEVHEPKGDGLGALGEQMQLNVVVFGRGAGQH